MCGGGGGGGEAGLRTLSLTVMGLMMCRGAFSADQSNPQEPRRYAASNANSNASSLHNFVDNDPYNCSLYLSRLFSANISILELPSQCRTNRYNLPAKVVISLVLGGLIISTAVGNALVILAVILVKKLQTPNNLLIVSLASSDFLVAVLVLPWALIAQLEGMWIFDSAMCDMFMIFDMTLCTSSILNLCAISIDRYLVVTRPFTYGVKRTNARMLGMIALTWLISVLVTVPPYIGWKEPFIPGVCNYSEDLGYQIYATFGAFYMPLFVMLVLYGRIFRLAHRIARADARMKMSSAAVHHDHEDNEGNGARGSSGTGDSPGVESEHVTLTVRLVRFKSAGNEACFAHSTLRHSTNGTKGGGANNNDGGGKHLTYAGPESVHRDSLTPASQTPSGFSSGTASPACNDYVMQARRSTSQHQNILRRATKKKSVKNTETKAIKTLGVIMGCFTLCWLPFFIVQIAVPIMKIKDPNAKNHVPNIVAELFLWLGYMNSFLNPIIYAKYNRDFRTPFKEILLCRCRKINARLRTESYAEQYGLPLRTVKRRDGGRHTARRKSSELVVSVNRSGKVCSYLSNGTQSSNA